MQDQNHLAEQRAKDPFVAGVVGAAAGIALGSAATLYLSNKDNRKKVMERLDDVKKKTQDSFNLLSSRAEHTKDNIQDKASKKLKNNGSIAL